MAFATAESKSNSDILTSGQSNKAEDFKGFQAEMKSELHDMLLKKFFSMVRKSTVTCNQRILQFILTFHHKWNIDNTISRHSNRICGHSGKQQQGTDYWEIFSLVVQFLISGILFILSIIKGLKTKQVGFLQAFLQVTLKT